MKERRFKLPNGIEQSPSVNRSVQGKENSATDSDALFRPNPAGRLVEKRRSSMIQLNEVTATEKGFQRRRYAGTSSPASIANCGGV
jgi:hypothetical protein